MTNEKTIEILKELWRYSKTDKYSESEIREAIKNAIKAVEAVDYDCADCKWYLEVKKNELSTEDRKVTDGDSITRQAVITMLQKIENVVEDGDGFQFNEWVEYPLHIPSAEKTDRDLISRAKDIIRNDSNLSEAQVIDLLRRIDELPSAEK